MVDIQFGTIAQAVLGNRQHHQMLGAGRAWFAGQFPKEWAQIKALPADQAIDQILMIMESTYVKLYIEGKK